METVINRGYQFKIVPTAEQKAYFLQSFGCARKLYNHYVDTLYTYLDSIGYENGYIRMKEIRRILCTRGFPKKTAIAERYVNLQRIPWPLLICGI